MHPVLFQLGPLPIPTYGALSAAGMLLALVLSVRAGRRERIGPGTILDLFFWVLSAGIAGSWAMHVLLELPHYSTGFVFYGGLLGAVAALWTFAHKRSLDPWRLGDLLAGPTALAHALGRVGCWAAGCCYGKACAVPPGVLFPGAPGPVHPTQLYEAVGNVALFFLLAALRPRKRFHGQVLLTYVLGYAALRFVVERWRGDPRGEWWGWSTSQLVAMAAGAAAVAGLVWLGAGRNRITPREPPAPYEPRP